MSLILVTGSPLTAPPHRCDLGGSSPKAARAGLISRCLLFAVLVSLTACRTSQHPATPPVAETTSVKPGINAEYLKPDINVAQWVERFEKEGREIYDHRDKIIAAARIRTGTAVADIGCGTGLFTPMLASASGARGRVYAVDIVPEFLKRVDQRAKEAGLSQVQTVLCTERSVELPPDSIDTAFICDVYHHFEFPQHSLASLHRALRRHGEVLLIDFKREPGVSSDWILNHVRAGQAQVTAEFEAAGFRKVEELPLLKDNYVLRFRKVDR
ncbi:MAG: class I SAM-dependent methyltransferase [Verrucomicrobiales bacterium]|nr:class I SAM-dependent methyltransferase [Verrucomicrobiales bacterium]